MAPIKEIPMRRSLLMCAIAVALGGVSTGAQTSQPTGGSEAALLAKARAIHQRVIALDTHNDINPGNFGLSYNYTQDLGNQVNLPKMKKGGLDASFFIVYVGQGELTPDGYTDAYRQAVEKFEAIHRLTRQIAPDQIELALTADDVRRINAKGKKVALIGIENGYPLGDARTAVSRVKEFYLRGGRYMSLAHNGHSQLSDSNTGEREGWKWNGLSPLGRQVIAEMNRWGIMIDVSHPSKESMIQTLELTKAPIIASHSAVRALCNHSRNMDDEQLLALKKNGGVIQMVAFANYVKELPPASAEQTAAVSKLNEQFGLPPQGGGRGGGGGRGAAAAQLSDEKRADYQKQLADITARYPAPPRATVKDFVDHIDYAVKKIGIDHVGISSDFDGGGGVDGWSGAHETINVTVELVRRGYTEAQIAKMWSGNLLRVMEDVQKVARGLQPAGTH
ncbi:MAG: dipeptidase [Vicinamibacterales bacterium]